jgi:hypothetical protein
VEAVRQVAKRAFSATSVADVPKVGQLRLTLMLSASARHLPSAARCVEKGDQREFVPRNVEADQAASEAH